MVEHRAFKEAVYARFARLCSALASPLRVELLDLLAQREWAVNELAAEVDASTANVSQHLLHLARERLVSVRRYGTQRLYRVADLEVSRLLSLVQRVAAERSPELAAVLAAQRDPDKITDLIEGKNVLLIDVRPADEFRASHISGAVSMPLGKLRSARLPKDKRIIVYCRGPYCTFADEAVEILRDRGYKAKRIELSPTEWELRGGDVVRAS